MYLLAADVILALHAAFVLFASMGALLALKWRWIPWFQLPAATWGVYVEVSGCLCPLTSVENAFRVRAGESAYRGDCIGHHLTATLYPESLTRTIQFGLAAVVLTINLVMYAWLLRKRLQRS